MWGKIFDSEESEVSRNPLSIAYVLKIPVDITYSKRSIKHDKRNGRKQVVPFFRFMPGLLWPLSLYCCGYRNWLIATHYFSDFIPEQFCSILRNSAFFRFAHMTTEDMATDELRRMRNEFIEQVNVHPFCSFQIVTFASSLIWGAVGWNWCFLLKLIATFFDAAFFGETVKVPRTFWYLWRVFLFL